MQDLNCFEPTAAERVRTLLRVATSGALATLDVDGRPYLAEVPFIEDGTGTPVMVLSNLSLSAIRARQDRRAAITIGDGVTLQGDLLPVPGLQQLELEERFVHAHPELIDRVRSLDYSWFRLVPLGVVWLDESGSENRLNPEDLASSQPDPLSHLSAELVASISALVGDDIVLLCTALAGRWLTSEATLLKIDRYGLLVDATDPSGTRLCRIPFGTRLTEPEDVHVAVANLVHSAKSSRTQLVTTANNNPTVPSDATVPADATAWTSALETEPTFGLTISDPGRWSDHELDVPADSRIVETSDLAEGDRPRSTTTAEQAESAQAKSAQISETQVSETQVSPDRVDTAQTQSESPAPTSAAPGEVDRNPGDSDPSGPSSPRLLDSIEADGGRRSDIDGVDRSRHRNSYSLFDSLQSSNGQSWALGAEQDGDPFGGVEDELSKVDGVVAGRHGQGLEPVLFDDVEPGWEFVEASVGE